jgi:hypothetical protein
LLLLTAAAAIAAANCLGEIEELSGYWNKFLLEALRSLTKLRKQARQLLQ